MFEVRSKLAFVMFSLKFLQLLDNSEFFVSINSQSVKTKERIHTGLKKKKKLLLKLPKH